jgi:hypothetical protein
VLLLPPELLGLLSEGEVEVELEPSVPLEDRSELDLSELPEPDDALEDDAPESAFPLLLSLLDETDSELPSEAAEEGVALGFAFLRP